MKPSIIKAGICTAVTATVTMTLTGLLPVTAHADPPAPDMGSKLAGKTVFLDPGHQGPYHSEDLARQVGDGRGGTKECQTTGMTTVNGVPEHTITWNVAQLVKASLESLGARVVLSRQDDTGWGGCIDDRARAANESGAAVAVSIHADSAPAMYRGFHAIIPALPIPDSKIDQIQSGPGLAASKAMRDAYLQAGFPAANYAGVVDGLQTRKDVAGPALTAVPDVFIEMGNGANSEDAALLESAEGQLRHAIAITTGLVGHLLGVQWGNPSQDRPAAVPNAPQPGIPLEAPGATPSTPTPNAPVPGSPQAQAAPGTYHAPETPQSQSTPGTSQSPGSRQSPGADGNLGGLVGAVVQQLMPLAKSLGLDGTAVVSEVMKLADTLAKLLVGSSK